MSTQQVQRTIHRVLQEGVFIDEPEAADVFKTAVKSPRDPLVKGEAGAIADLFNRQPSIGGSRPVPPGMMVTLAVPENPNDVIWSKTANAAANVFFTEHAFVRNGDGTVAPPIVSGKLLAKMRQAFEKVELAGLIEWKPGRLPDGNGFERVLLKQEPGNDRYTYTALLPAGPVVLHPRPVDLEKSRYFYVERSGGLAGLTTLLGPIYLKDPRDV